MASNDYIPSDDAGLLAFATTFAAALTLNWEDLAVDETEMTNLTATKTAFGTKLNELQAAQTAAQSKRVVKDTLREGLVSTLRNLTNRIQFDPNMNNNLRAQFGIRIRDTTPTAVSAPTSQPVIFINTANRLAHTIEFRDSATPLSKAKPAGAAGCEIYRKVGGVAPTSVAECEFITLDSASPHLIEYGAESGGLMVHYLARWATRSGLTGPTSDVMSATVVA